MNNFPIITFVTNDLTQMVNFPTWIPGCVPHSPALLDLSLFSDASICSTMAFPPLGNSDNVVFSVFIDFPSNSKRDIRFHCIGYDYSHADWYGFRDHVRDFTWDILLNSVLLLLLVNFVSGFSLKLMYISHRKYQVLPHLSLWFSATCTAAIAHRNRFFVFINKINLLNLK